MVNTHHRQAVVSGISHRLGYHMVGVMYLALPDNEADGNCNEIVIAISKSREDKLL